MAAKTRASQTPGHAVPDRSPAGSWRPPSRVVIIGGGISGLAAAHRLLELAQERGCAIDVRILDAGDRLGGVIGTERQDGCLLEAGPDCFVTEKPWALALSRRLGLADHLVGTNPRFRRSFVARRGRLLPVPEGFQLLAPSRLWPLATSPVFSPWGKLRMGLELFLPPSGLRDESLGSFVRRRLGREALERMAQPMVAGIYGADPWDLSLQATLPRFLKMEQEHGSVIRALWSASRRMGGRGEGAGARVGNSGMDANGSATPAGSGSGPDVQTGVSGARYGLFASFDTGMQCLVDALAARLPAGCARLGARVHGLVREPGGGWRVQVQDGRTDECESVTADAVCLALPAPAAARLLEHTEAGEQAQQLASLLRQIRCASCATLSLWYRRQDVPHPLDGFGFVVPAIEGRSLLGCTFSSVKLPGRAPEGTALLRAFLGHAMAEQADDTEIETAVRADLAALLGITAAPQGALLCRHQGAMAQYAVGHLDRVAEVEERAAAIPGLALAGNGYRGIGIPDCVRSGETAAEALFAGISANSNRH